MKFETFIVYAKLFCVMFGTSMITLQSSLGQWSNAEGSPSKVQWIMILGGSVGTGLTATGAFLSNAFGEYIKTRNGNGGNGQPPAPAGNKPTTGQ